MQRRVLASIHVLVLGAICGLIPSYGADQVMHAEVERGAATTYHLDDPDLAGFKVKFGIRVTNLSGVPIDLPKPGTSEDGTDLFTMPEIDVKQPDGNWLYRSFGMIEDILDIKSVGIELSLTEIYNRVELVDEPDETDGIERVEGEL